MHHHRSSLSVRRAPSRELSSREDEASSPACRIRIAAADGHSLSDDDSGCIVDEYAWLPSGVRPDTVHAYFSALPAERVPLMGSSGAKWRLRQLRHQLPPHDSDPAYCGHLKDEDEMRQLSHFDKRRQEECLGRGCVQIVPYDRSPNCTQCALPLPSGSVGVWAERVQAWFHPACFVCFSCRELLVDLVYFKHETSVYCGRHHAEKYRPRCARCDELIFSSECAEAEGHSWHVDHLRCAVCDSPLGGHHYARGNDGQIVCSACRKLPSCATCAQPISASDASIVQGEQQWHATNRCFRCRVCQRALLGHAFALSSPSSSSSPSSLLCSPACPRTSSKSMEHIYETVLSEPCSSSSPFSPRRLHPCHSERHPKMGGYECLRPLYSDVSNYFSSSSSESDDELLSPIPPPPPAPIRRFVDKTRPPGRRSEDTKEKKSKNKDKASPKHLPYAQKKQNTRCIVS